MKSKQDKIIIELLQETVKMTDNKISKIISLNEDVKQESIRVALQRVLSDLSEKLTYLNTTPIDRTRGDIKELRELENIQTAITKVEALLERSGSYIDPLIDEYISAISKSIMYLNQYANHFKDAYRMKKTVLVLKYQSVVLSIVSAVDYLCAKTMSITPNDLTLKDRINMMEISALKTLRAFINECKVGQIGTLSREINTMREFYLEVDHRKISTILEASDIISTVIDGVSNLYRNIDRGGKVTGLLFKSAGILAALMSVREIIYTIFRSRFKIQDLFDNLRGFANAGNGTTPLTKLLQFSSRFVADTEENSKVASRDIIAQNKEISQEVKNITDNSVIDYNEKQEKEYVTLIPKKRDDYDEGMMDF